MVPESTQSTLTSTLISLGNHNGDEKLGIDEVLRLYAGEFGPWQLRHFVLASLGWAGYALHNMVVIFADREPAWRCTDRTGSGCQSGPVDNVCGLEPGSWEWVGGPGVSTVTQWGLVCGERYKVGLVQSAYYAGCMIGCGIFGHLSDTFLGRKGSITILCIMAVIFGILTAISPTYIVYVVFRVLTGLSTGALGPCAFVLSTEPIGPSYRAIAGMSTFYPFSLGIVSLSIIAYFVTSWRMLYIVSSLPTLLYIIVALPFIQESPRWYLIRGKPHKALEIMQSIAEKNNRHLPSNISIVLDDENSTTKHADRRSSTIVDVVRSPITCTILVVAVIVNFLCSIVYYGLTLNVTNLTTNLYISTAANAVAEMPAFALTAVFINRLGRKPLAVGTMWLSGGFCVAGSLMGNEGFGRLVCGAVGIFGISASFNLLLVYESELFPTEVRNATLGVIQQAVQMAAILAPIMVVMGGMVAIGVFGICGIAGGMLAFFLPETLNKPLYDTMAGMEEGEKMQRGLVMQA